MKKILIFPITLLFAFSLQAQFSWGVRTGVQVSNLHFSKATEPYYNKVTYLVPGFYFQQQLNERSAFSVDVLFSNKGFNQRVYNSNGTQQDVRVVLPYITFPILYHRSIGSSITVFGGIEPAVKLVTSSVVNDERETDNEVLTRRGDFGLTGGVSLPLSENYSLMARYTLGLVNVLDRDRRFFDPGTGMTSNGYDLGYRFTNRALQLSLTSPLKINKDEGRTRVSYGLRQGISFSQVYGSGIRNQTGNPDPTKMRIAYEGGFDFRLDIQKYFFASTGLSFIQKGGQVEGDDPIRISALMLPLMIGVSPIKTERATFSIEGGIGISRHLSIENPYERPSRYSNTSDYMGTFIYGFELSIPASENVSAFLGYRNGWDMGDFYEADGFMESVQFNARTKSINVGVRMRTTPRNKQRDEDDNNTSEIGLKGGFNLNGTKYASQPAGSPDHRDLKAGAQVGMFFKIRLGKRTSLIPELHYLATYYSAIENPWVISVNANAKFAVEAGIQWGFIVGKHKGTVGNYEEVTSKMVDLGAVAGVKYMLSDKLDLGVRYFHSTKDTFAWYDNGSRIGTQGFNRNVQCSLYYSF